MSEKTKNILYGVVVALLNAAMALFTALNIITWVSVNDIIFLFVFSKSLWIVSLMTLVFHIGKLFEMRQRDITAYFHSDGIDSVFN